MVNKFFLRGLGFLNDAYDLSVINIINVILEHQYGKTVFDSNMKSSVSTSALIGAVLGQLVFGVLGDIYGRKNCMVATCALLIIGGILCAAAYGGSDLGTLWFLVVARGILGFGIGGEYPLAASSSSEDATSTADRNRRNLFSASILSVIGANSTLQTIALQNVLISAVALPGYYVACFFINKMGRKLIMLQGLTWMTIIFFVLAIWWDSIKGQSALFIILFGLTLFFSNFGPNMSTFVMPTEMYPTAIKSSCHGFSAAMGKAGAAIGSYGFAHWVKAPGFGYVGTWYTFAGICLLTLLLTWFCMFDNNDGDMSNIDNEFKAKLALETNETRQSFVAGDEPHEFEKDVGYIKA
ncbi:hypothetical protein SPRG_22256 [Saprolegnia parasitica CBS 223.65]|uniref:Major facilitator superfamily (MFS) profile domain-containing protein n=1 Tax=Saprolegnia parasitica (strain CBS 223.65) TaxID=695850 RepID=A0A067CAU8_SAPPC|nr:hypothetical protein SPRG_22256 [Saprolegnia parasitica CBS 223.65]KDO23947.1 hypothetical protein SPRG_22256 [Saprolegnia parasitica CBS 223.65]|eukprot:XP_012205420.1 hypothetical protein SPRG_22256 [Saprolegnia parasitica CBS 223.65]